MRRVCSWCRKELGDVDLGEANQNLVTHGICPQCTDLLFAQMGTELGMFLDRFGMPVVVVDREGIITTANDRAQTMLGKDLIDIEGKKGGDVFECAYAHLPGGCGKTTHCSGCTVRRAVMETHETGVCIKSRPAYINRAESDGTERLDLLISTERVGDVVLLRIDKTGKS